MKKILIGAMFLLSACSSNSNDTKVLGNDVNSEVSDATVDVSNLMLDSSLDASPGPIPGYETTSPSTITKVITLTNSSSSPYPLSSIKISEPSNGFTISLNRCPAILDAKRYCQIKVSFSSRSLYNGQQNAALEINAFSVQLSALVSNQPNPDTTGSANIELSLNSPFSPATAASYRILTIKNIGDGTAFSLAPNIPSSYKILLNRCPSSLKPNTLCIMHIHDNNFRLGSSAAEESISVSSSAPTSTIELLTGLPPNSAPIIRGFDFIGNPVMDKPEINQILVSIKFFDVYPQMGPPQSTENFNYPIYNGVEQSFASRIYPTGFVSVEGRFTLSTQSSISRLLMYCNTPGQTLDTEYAVDIVDRMGQLVIAPGTNNSPVGVNFYAIESDFTFFSELLFQFQIYSISGLSPQDSKITCRLLVF